MYVVVSILKELNEMERLTEKQHLKLNKQEAYKLYMNTLHELALVTNELYDTTVEFSETTPTHKKDNLYAF